MSLKDWLQSSNLCGSFESLQGFSLSAGPLRGARGTKYPGRGSFRGHAPLSKTKNIKIIIANWFCLSRVGPVLPRWSQTFGPCCNWIKLGVTTPVTSTTNHKHKVANNTWLYTVNGLPSTLSNYHDRSD